MPRAVAIAVAAPIDGPIIKFTNNPWALYPARLAAELGVENITLINDFAAVGHALTHVDSAELLAIAGPDIPLPATGTITVIGPGTGLGVAQLWLEDAKGYRVQATEGGHIDFAPLDAIDDILLAKLRERHRRVSVERVVAGPAIVDWMDALCTIEGRAIPTRDDRVLWKLGIEGGDNLAAAAVERICRTLGSVAGDLALAHGAAGVVVAGGLGLRLEGTLPASGFAARFVAKGRFEAKMSAIPVKLITHPQPGLLGAAAAFIQEHCA